MSSLNYSMIGDERGRLGRGVSFAAREVMHCVDHAITAVGGRAYYRKSGLERLARDVRAAAFHPIQELRQLRMTGRILLGLDPAG